NFSINNKVYNNKTVVELLLDTMDNDGSFSSLNRKNQKIKAYANEQVWCLIALEIADANYDKEKALNYLYSCQNSDNGFGYGQYSDCGTSSWVVSLSEIMNMDENVISKTVDYINGQWDGLYQTNDSSSMAPFLSTHYANDKQMRQFLSSSYKKAGEYFTWGASSEENEYAKYPSIQCLGDFNNKKSIYQILDDIYDGNIQPTLVSGENQSYVLGTNEELTFKSDADINDFQKLLVDNEEVDSDYYTLKEGSTIVTLNKEYLNKLSKGSHSLQIVSTNGTVATVFTIREKETPKNENTNTNVEDNKSTDKKDAKSVKTGDANNPYIMTLIASMLLYVYLVRRKNEIN
ncbi:MAG: hypothetical protein EGR78_05445, partial [Erysipelotrichaceae bacterium]|nr:hypothetical protein [Erysipelotrichaceae bacterium]